MPRIQDPRVLRPSGRCRASASALGAVLLATGLLSPAQPVRAEGCRLALVLALDVSGSVSEAEDRLQRGGLAAALLAPEVTRAFLDHGTVALYVFEWAGARSQVALLPGWQRIESEEDLLRAAAAIHESRRGGPQATGLAGGGTAVGSALVHAATALAAGPDCRRRTVDVSGDGTSTEGVAPEAALAGLLDGVTVNALVIHEPIEDPMLEIMRGGDVTLVAWFERSVLHGPGAFSIVADGYDDYERAMTAKLLRELELPLVSEAGAPAPRA